MAPKLAAKGGAGRAAAMGSAFHARCADPDGQEAKDRWNRLSQEEQSEVESWIKPTDIVLEDGTILSYEHAKKEVPLGLTELGTYAPKGTTGNVTEGTCDLYWVVEQGGVRIAYVPDIKRSEYTVADGPRSLQILGYALAVASLEKCHGYCAGIWAAKEGTWSWGDLYLYGRDDDAIMEHWERIKAAALNDSEELSSGPHCQGCYGRKRCPAWMLPPELIGTSLAPFAEEGMAITSDQAVNLIGLVKRAEDMAATVKKLLQAHVKDGGVISDGKGKEWRPVVCQGRVGLDAKLLEKEQPDVFKKYYKPGAPYEQWRWLKERE